MQTHGEIYGVDISSNHLEMAAKNLPGIPLVLGDGHDLPFPGEIFDITLCHFLLLWVSNPVQVVGEMARVTKPGGVVMALAEPDYGGRIDFPSELEKLGKWQQAALFQQGADPLVGRKLRATFQRAGLSEVESGVLGGQWAGKPHPDDWEMEWKVLENDIQTAPNKLSDVEIKRLKNLDKLAWEQGDRILFVPTFYAWGRVPNEGNTAEASKS